MSQDKLHYTITVFAGGLDIYAQLPTPSTLRSDPQAEYEYVSHTLQSRLEEDFGIGAELVRLKPEQYEVNVDKVQVS